MHISLQILHLKLSWFKIRQENPFNGFIIDQQQLYSNDFIKNVMMKKNMV